MGIISDDDILKRVEKEKDRAINAMSERNRYLGIYRERILVVLTRDDIEDKIIYDEVREALSDSRAIQMTLSRAIELKYLKKYMRLAEEYNINCKLVDGASYVGNVALVVSAKDAIKTEHSIFVENIKDKFKRLGLSKYYYDCLDGKLCKKHYDLIREKCPELLDKFEEIGFLASFFGVEDIIDEKEGKI